MAKATTARKTRKAKSKLGRVWKGIFCARRVIIISDHKTQHVPFGAATQAVAAVATLGFIVWASFSSGSYMAAQRVIDDAKALASAGACMIVLEAVPSALGKQVQDAIDIPVIGIGAGPDVAGQILLMYDMLDIYQGRKAKFVKNFMVGAPSIFAALETYVKEVKSGAFPSPEYCY